jgi:hypothetical protein
MCNLLLMLEVKTSAERPSTQKQKPKADAAKPSQVIKPLEDTTARSYRQVEEQWNVRRSISRSDMRYSPPSEVEVADGADGAHLPLSGSRNLLELTTRDPFFAHDRSSRSLCPDSGDEPDDAVRAAQATRGRGPIDESIRRDHPGERGDV